MDDEQLAKAIERVTSSPLFPFEGDVSLRPHGELLEHEIIREGEGGRPCASCGADDRIWWSNDRWKVTALRPTANPVGLFLETVDHIEFEDFDERIAAEFGVLTMQLEAAIRSLDAVGRTHIHHWGDGSSHFHVWFQGRPARRLEFYGWGNVLWSQVSEPLPADQIDANHSLVIDRFAERAGGAVAVR